ncbi:MAG: C25 family cysteine peptidase [bacterium]
MGVQPRVVLVGQAYEDVNSPKNVLGTYYSPDSTGICYFGNSCVHDAWLVDFDFDRIPDLPLGRIPADNLQEVQNAVQTMLDELNHQHISSPSTFILDGDLDWCTPVTEPDATLQTVRGLYEAHGISSILVKDSQFTDCYDLAVRRAAAVNVVQGGIREMVGSGYISTRQRSPALLIQNDFSPSWTMSLVPRQQRIVAWFPGCDFGDADRINTGNTSMVEMWTTAPPSGTTASFWISHGRGAWGRAHLLFMREIMEWRFSGQCLDTYDVAYQAIRSLAAKHPGLIDYLSTAHVYGWPVGLADFPQMPGPTGVAGSAGLHVTSWAASAPNPFKDETCLWYRLAARGRVTIEVLNVSGRLVATLCNEVVEAGAHSVLWKGVDQQNRPVAAGVYFARGTIGDQKQTSRMILIR